MLKSVTRLGAVCFLVSAVLLVARAEQAGGDSPSSEDLSWKKVELKNGTLSAVLAVPDAKDGFYQRERFDQSAFIYRAQAGNVKLFGPWKLNFRRGALDAVTGPAGEFGMLSPLGYDEASPGEAVVKIGVGHLKRVDESPYSFTKAYEVINPGRWTFSQGESFFESSHQLSPLRGWAYQYRKRIELVDPRTIKVAYHLKNTGEKTIITDYYAHNLFVFNDEPVSKGDRIEISADAAGPKLAEPVRLHPRSIEFDGPITPNKGYYLEIPLPPHLKNPLLARIFHQKSGASISLSSDYSPQKLVFYAHDKALCAEPFIAIQLAPGEEMNWSDTYEISLKPSGS